MYITGATIEQMDKALAIINEDYEGNVAWKSLDNRGKRIMFTLKVWDSRGEGAKISYSYDGKSRRTAAACWHVHGDFFDAILAIAPSAIITTGLIDKRRIYKDEDGKVCGNWIDANIGSQLRSVMYSECCECNR